MEESNLSPNILRELVTVAEVHKRRPEGDLTSPVRKILATKDVEKQSLAAELAGLWKLDKLTADVRQLVSQGNGAPEVIASALVSLGRLDTKAAESFAPQFASSNQPPGVQVAAVRSILKSNLKLAAQLAAPCLAKSESESFSNEIVALFLNQKDGTDLLSTSIESLADSGEALAADPAMLIHRSLSAAGRTDEKLMASLDKILGNKATKKIEYSAEYVKALAGEVRQSGNAANGRNIYNAKIANCAACHKLNGNGGVQGPDLSVIGAGRSEEQLIESVLWPNRQIREGFMSIKVLTADGDLLTGLPVKETDEELHLLDSVTGKIRRIAFDDIEDESESGSAMPAGLTASMTRSELRDLIRFLSELRTAN